MANNRFLRAGESDGNNGADWFYVPPVGGYTNKTSDDQLKAGVANKANYLTSLQIGVGVVLANATEVVLKNGSTVIWRMSLGVNVFPPTTINFDPPLRSSSGSFLAFAAITLFTTGNITVNAQGYTA